MGDFFIQTIIGLIVLTLGMAGFRVVWRMIRIPREDKARWRRLAARAAVYRRLDTSNPEPEGAGAPTELRSSWQFRKNRLRNTIRFLRERQP